MSAAAESAPPAGASGPIRPVPISFFKEMVAALGHLQRAGRQKVWIETPDTAAATMLFFFSPWCDACRAAALAVAALERNFAGKGLAVLGVSEYAAPDETEAYRKAHGFLFPFVYESMHKNAREDEGLWHRRACRAVGDAREWGTPLFLFHFRGGETFACAGAFAREEGEAFLRARLG